MDSQRSPACDWTVTGESGVIGFRGGLLRAVSEAVPADTRTWFSTMTAFSVEAEPGQRTQVAVLAPPLPHLLVIDDDIFVCGVRGKRFVREFLGPRAGFVVAVRPGLLTGRYGDSASALAVDQVVPISRWIGRRQAEAHVAAVNLVDSHAGKARCLYRMLEHGFPAGAEATKARDLVEAVLTASPHCRVKEAADLHKLSIRSLQRLFKTYVGIGPKAAVNRTRLIQAATSLVSQPENWARLVPQLGYFDQPHFINDFRKGLGITPVRFAGQVQRAREGGLPAQRLAERAAGSWATATA